MTRQAPRPRVAAWAPLLSRSKLIGAASRVLSLSALVRWGAGALILAGTLGLASSAIYLVAAYRASEDPYAYVSGPVPLLELSFWLQLPEWFLLCFGLAGLYALLRKSGEPARWLALGGAAFAAVPSVFWLGLIAYERLVGSMIFSDGPYHVFTLILPSGILLSGVAALRTRGLGRWRSAVLIACVFATPFVSEYLPFFVLSEEAMMAMQPSFGTLALIVSPRLIADAGFVLFGCVLFGAENREAGLIAAERRTLEEKNLALARRLYAEAWIGGDLSVVDEIAAPECEDRYGAGRGPESLKRSVAALRATFPDLRFVVEEQRIEGDTVTTRWRASGTDLGGVLWYPPTGRATTFAGTYVDRFSGGKLVEHSGDADMTGLLQQLGLPAGGGG